MYLPSVGSKYQPLKVSAVEGPVGYIRAPGKTPALSMSAEGTNVGWRPPECCSLLAEEPWLDQPHYISLSKAQGLLLCKHFLGESRSQLSTQMVPF